MILSIERDLQVRKKSKIAGGQVDDSESGHFSQRTWHLKPFCPAISHSEHGTLNPFAQLPVYCPQLYLHFVTLDDRDDRATLENV